MDMDDHGCNLLILSIIHPTNTFLPPLKITQTTVNSYRNTRGDGSHHNIMVTVGYENLDTYSIRVSQ